MSLKLEIVTPIGKTLEAEVSSVTAPGEAGELTVLPEHRAGVILLSGGAVRYSGAESGVVFVRGGVAEVGPDRVLILADEAVLSGHVDRAAAQSLLEASVHKLGGSEYLDDARFAVAERERAYAEAQLRAAAH